MNVKYFVFLSPAQHRAAIRTDAIKPALVTGDLSLARMFASAQRKRKDLQSNAVIVYGQTAVARRNAYESAARELFPDRLPVYYSEHYDSPEHQAINRPT